MSTFHEDLWSDTDGWKSINDSLPSLDFNITHTLWIISLISQIKLIQYAKLFLNMITISAEDALKIESCTREQSLTPRWYHERKCRLTSSNFGTFCKGAITTAKVKTLLYKESSKLSNTAIMWGKLHESTAFDQYQSMHSSKSGLILRKSGIFISNEDGFLAASPDGILHNNENKCGMLEIKCPYSCRNLTVLEACKSILL